MKIAYVNQTYPPMVTGVSHMLRRLAEGMADRGHEILVIVASDTGRPYTISTRRGLTIVRLRSYQNPMAARQRFMPWPRRQIESLLDAFAPEIVHFHDPGLASVIGVTKKGRRPVPTVLTAHIHPEVARRYTGTGAVWGTLVERGTMAAAGWIYRRCTAVVSPTRTIADCVRAIGGRSARVISNGIDLERFNPAPLSHSETQALRAKFGLEDGRKTLLHVGRLSREKNIPTVLRAAALAMQCVDAQLVVAGNGPEKDRLMALCRELGIADRVRFPGFVAHDKELPALYRLADVFVSASEIEAQGLVLLEAASCGTPVVAVRAGASPEIVRDRVNGRLVRPGDAAAVAGGIVEILQDPAAAGRMGQAGRVLAEEHALESTIRAHENLYMELVRVTDAVLRNPARSLRRKRPVHRGL